MQTLRYWDYYGMTETFTDLFERSKKQEIFHSLYDTITSKENILLAYRSIKSNKGSKTPGTDGKTINDIKKLSDEELVTLIQDKLKNYRPKKVRRKLIQKDNGKWRPLGIPCIFDRVIQQCFKQVLEPIAEAQFYKHSYGFRPLRSTHHAMARVQFLVNQASLHFVVDIDIKGFFDNINHTLLIKQLWNLGIRDRKVLACIFKMLKAEIDGEGSPTKGSPQGGLLSPLLSNVVLNDLDQWVSKQWEFFPLDRPFKTREGELLAKKRTNLKEGYLVRYCDDFKILCRDWKTAQKWYHAVKSYLKHRLKLDISPEKSQIINLRKRSSEFLGFTIRANRKRNKRVAHTGIKDSKKQKIIAEAKKRILKLQASPTAQNALLFNSFVLGIHNYFNRATHVNNEFSRLAYKLHYFMYNRLKSVGKYEHPANPPPTYKKFYRLGYRTFKVAKVYLYPIADVRTKNSMNFSQGLTPFTEEGRKLIQKKLRVDIQQEISLLMQSNLPTRSVEYMDNRISRYSMKLGKCEITGIFLTATNVHCHHFIPLHLGGNDSFNNLRILHKEVHKLIHIKDIKTINTLITILGLTKTMINKINQYRKECSMDQIL
ncbi:group II intron reverse transcriptase/maturase [Anaerobacillus isosaccharinicus]|uniref:Group II intron reverse transcriptase/maturase n=2 Tax=Anaerobacillus isosaccharinicus TaxID=1532552 RepID=A0A1S2MDD9_9BACI|nr:group II intron reverse transcriptase/maturase [Anaerobacillus isosaccharinicus]MBA5585040.1 group II intron reverse transcriptase/maturase [Anaerobacillus isosaccharinicus]MBA5587119.1 group II intron reverse transcriptase/maturase [Anaerobacillus isosaccharinicus]MBA5587180.1 group II intron reverse transcriptase/maturase [Anaerobacillus isosaccharinicus]QOY34624.1 group II intron reverse transcriptase/maturase [Anaerobacillus isosaccharinicus]QOY34685.1 group II intron reverse transcript